MATAGHGGVLRFFPFRGVSINLILLLVIHTNENNKIIVLQIKLLLGVNGTPVGKGGGEYDVLHSPPCARS